MTENHLEVTGEEILATVSRGGVIESHHNGHIVELGSDGGVGFSRGNIHELIFPRSSIKGIQSAAMVKMGLNLEPRLLALVSASHSGSEVQQSAVLEILRKGKIPETALQNSLDRPLGEVERRAWGQRAATSLAQNCSGKHAGMLLTCVVNGWSMQDYLLPTHPLQMAIRGELELLGEEVISITSIDGCGAPLFLISLLGLARAIHNLTISIEPARIQVVAACRAHPEMVAGEGRTTTRLMRQVPGLFLKEGAEGVGVGSLPDGRTFAFKISDGSPRPYGPLVIAALRLFNTFAEEEIAPIYGGNQVVGSITANF